MLPYDWHFFVLKTFLKIVLIKKSMWKFLISKFYISLRNIKKYLLQARTQVSTWAFPAFVFAILFCLALPHSEQVFVVESGVSFSQLPGFERVFILCVLQLNSCPKDVLPFSWIALPDTLALYCTSWEGGLLAVVTVPSVLRASWSSEFFQRPEQYLFISGLWEKERNLLHLSCFIVLLKSRSGE